MNPSRAAAARKLALHCLAMAVALAVVLISASAAWACPGCKDALAANDNQGGQLVAGYFWSILFMMSMPFIIVSTFGGSMYLSVRRARAQQAEHAAAERAEAVARAQAAPRGTTPAERELVEV